MSGRPPQLSPRRLVAGLVLPAIAYLVIRVAIGSATGALAITEAVPATWLVISAIARRRVDRLAVLSTVAVGIAFLVYALTGGDPVALKLRRGAVTGTVGLAMLASLALGRPLLLLVAEHAAKLNPERQAELETRLAEPDRRRALAILTAIIGLTFTIDGASQIALALSVPTAMFVPDSTAARVAVFGTGAVATAWYFRHQREERARGPRPPRETERSR